MLSVLNAVFQKKTNIEAFANEFGIHHLIWFLHDRIKEFRKYLIQQKKVQKKVIYEIKQKN